MRLSMRKPVAMMLLAVVSSSASAAAWVKVGSDENGTTYVDSPTIRRAGNRVKMWSLSDFKTPQVLPTGKQYMSTKTEIEYDCKKERVRLLAVFAHSRNMANGEKVYIASHPGKWGPLASGTKNEELWKLACGKK
jgi:hypothetical protein